jgi:hypothetical protein
LTAGERTKVLDRFSSRLLSKKKNFLKFLSNSMLWDLSSESVMFSALQEFPKLSSDPNFN